METLGKTGELLDAGGRGGGLFTHHGGGDVLGQVVHVRDYGERRATGTGERKDLREEIGISRLLKDYVLSSSTSFYPVLLLWHVRRGHVETT